MNNENLKILTVLSIVLMVIALIVAFSFPSAEQLNAGKLQRHQQLWNRPTARTVDRGANMQAQPQKPVVPPEMQLHEGEEEEGC